MKGDYYQTFDRKNEITNLPKKDYKLYEFVFESGTGSGYTYSVNGFDNRVNDPSKPYNSKTAGVVYIDVIQLENPHIKIDFTSIVHFVALGKSSSIQLEFILIRSSYNQEIPLGSWLFEVSNTCSNLAQTFNFFYCDSGLIKGNYNYSVRIAPVYINDCTITVTNCHITAFAHSKI